MVTKKVLIAEDSSVIQNLTKKILQFQNYEISAVKNGKDVLKALDKSLFDIILLDINMPVMDGMECARAVRAHTDPAKSKIPIIAITGNAKNYSEEDFHKAGINEFLPKPLDFDKLVDTVKKWTNS
jgi:two-component system cell cycle response regulator DivK